MFPSKIDFYTLKAFFSIYFVVQASFLMLFFLVEYVQLADSMRSNDVSTQTVLMYFLYKIPEVIDLTMFICLLIAILLQFTVMSRNLEIVAIRAGGGSMQRLCMPLILSGFLISFSVYYMQNQILPHTNRMAQQSRDTIRNKREAMFTNHVWMSPDKEHIINFAYFDWRENVLLDVTRYRIAGEDDKAELLQRQHWPMLVYDTIEEHWVARDGGEAWDIQFGDRHVESATPETLKKGSTFTLNLDIADLQQGKRKANQFSIQDLQNYISALRKLGYEVGHYQTELYAKYAKPFVPLFMMLLAMPLGIQVGRRGTFYGVGIGFGAGLSFLALFELFKEFGASGMLNPLVAGWTIIVVFGSIALYRFINLE